MTLQQSMRDSVKNKPYETVQELCNKLLSSSTSVLSKKTAAGSATSSPLISSPASSCTNSNSAVSKGKASPNKTITSDDFGFATLMPSASARISQCQNDKPLNLMTKGSVRGTASRSESRTLGRETLILTDSSEGPFRSYKLTHPIGSRKAAESVITYHEPMFQSVANTLFENRKNLMEKRKADEDKNSGCTGPPDTKKGKFSSAASSSQDTKMNKKKKCSIENIIERIRTEKTVSRGSPQEITPVQYNSNNADPTQEPRTFLPKIESVADSSNQRDCITKALCKQEIATEESEEGVPELGVGNTTIIDICKKEPVDSVESEQITCVKETNDKVDTQENKVSGSTNDSRQDVRVASPKSLKCDAKVNNIEMKKRKTEQNEPCGNLKVVKTKVIDTGKVESKKITKKTALDIEHASNDSKLEKDGEDSKIAKSSDSKNSYSEKVTKKDVLQKKIKEKAEETDPEKVKAKVKTDKKLSSVNREIQDNNKPKPFVKKRNPSNEAEINDKTGDKAKKGKRKKSDIESSDGNSVKSKKNKIEEGNTNVGTAKKKGRGCKSLEGENKGPKSGIKRPRKHKLPIACRRVKREASLNAATLVNILCESPRTPKFADKRSKSDSDLKTTPANQFFSGALSLSSTNLLEDSVSVNLKDGPFAQQNITAKNKCTSDVQSKSKSVKSPNTNRKVSFSDDSLDAVFEAVIQRSITETESGKMKKNNAGKDVSKIDKGKPKSKNNEKEQVKPKKKEHVKKVKNKTDAGKPENISNVSNSSQYDKSDKIDKKFRLKKIKKAIKLTASKSPDELAEKKKKARLARLERAKELLKTKKRVSDEFSGDEDSRSSDSESLTSSSDDVVSDTVSDTDNTASTELTKKERARKGSLCRAARTHVSVESKTVVENAMPSPQWCECCQSTYYPSQPTQGAQVWRIKQLVDKGSSKSPETIQTSSHHFIAAHASCEVRPYASPSHMSVIESSPYVGQIVPHGHIQCSACSCGHSGMFHPASCQNCTLGGVGNLMSCQRYGNTYSIPYPHSHGSYTHCGKLS